MSTKTDSGSLFERYGTPIAVLLGAVIVALAFAYGHPGAAPTPNGGGAAQQATAVDIKNVKTAGEPYIGDANAPVTVAFFYDYQCPFCKQFEQSVTPQLYDAYVKTGKLKIVFKDFQFLGNDSTTGAEFGRAVWEAYPDHYYDWYKAMFDAQDQEGDQGFGNLDSIVAMTKSKVPAIDTATITALITKNKTQYDAAINADRAEGAAMGVNGTPTVIVGTQALSGMTPDQFYSTISTEINKELGAQ